MVMPVPMVFVIIGLLALISFNLHRIAEALERRK